MVEALAKSRELSELVNRALACISNGGVSIPTMVWAVVLPC